VNTIETMTPTVALAEVLAPLDPRRALTLRETFESVLTRLEEWQTEARGLLVTDEEQTGKMARARLLRLEIRKVRVDLDKRRKDLKAGILVEGRAIDGAFAVFEGLSVPIERHLLDQEQFAERLVKRRTDALRDARQQALLALGANETALPAALGELSEEAWNAVLTDAQAAKAWREEQSRLAEDARVEAARIVAEREAQVRAERVKADAERQAREEAQRAENERLKAEAAESARVAREERAAREVERQRVEAENAADRAKVEGERKAERDKAEAERQAERESAKADQLAAEEKSRVEREARTRAEAEAAGLRKEEQERQAKEVESKKPTKAKYTIMVDALKLIAAQAEEPLSMRRAIDALRKIGEAS
jgi:hypothetical protein